MFWRRSIPSINSRLPERIPIFPLRGALLLPGGELPLHIFEERFIAMVGNALSNGRFLGMIQPRCETEIAGSKDCSLFDTGCVGRITGFEETPDRHYLITLKGVSRFRIKKEIKDKEMFRSVVPDWSGFEEDGQDNPPLVLDKQALKPLLKAYFEIHNMSCDADLIDDAAGIRIVTCLPMICPLDACEKQALLEAKTVQDRADMLITMIDMAVRNHPGCADYRH